MKLRRRYGHARSKYGIGARVEYTWAGELYGKKATVQHVRKDGVLIVNFDHDGPGSHRVIPPENVRPVR